MDALDPILEPLRDLAEGTIDFPSQRLTDNLTTILLTLTGLIAFLAGYVGQNVFTTLYAGLGGAGLTFLAVVPPWPFYNGKGERWLPARSGRGPGLGGVGGVMVDGRSVG